MSQLDGLIARSRKPGVFVERRRFTLSRERAIEKLREFSLRHPSQYVLELIQAAHFAGASYVAVDVSPHSALVAYVGGRRFLPEELEQIFDYLFADRGQRSQRHLVQLAVGLNALLQRKPRILRIESGDGSLDGTVRMDVKADGSGDLGTPADPLGGTYIFADFGTDWLARFRGVQWTPEQGLVEEKCLYTPAPILLNGRAPFGYHSNRNLKLHGISRELQRSFDDGARRGALGLSESSRGGFRIVIGGVWITTLEIPELGQIQHQGRSYFPHGVICDDDLQKTADQSDVVQDRRYTAMLHAIQPVATELLQSVSRRRYTPPELPILAPDSTVGREPLPERIHCVGPTGALTLEELQAIPSETPLFWIDLKAREQLEPGADPYLFPFRVLLLTAGQADTLRETLPDLPLSQLSTPEDTAFIRRVIERGRHEIEELRAPMSSPLLTGSLVIRLHRGGPLPFWRSEGETPVLVAHGGVSQWCGSAPIDLPGVSAVIELADATDAFDDKLPEACAAALAREVWRLLPDPLPEERRETYAPLAAALLARNLQPQFVEADGAARLEAMLPRSWGAGRIAALRRLPLAPILGAASDAPLGAHLTLEGMLALQGTDRVVEVPDDAGPRLAGLERVLGYGHLRWAGMDERPYAAVGWTGSGWTFLTEHAWRTPNLDQVIWLGPTLDTPIDDARWVKEPSSCSTLGMATRRGCPLKRPWDEGLRLLFDRLLEANQEDDWLTLCGGASLPRVRGLGRLALFQLARALAELDAIKLPPSDGGAPVSLALLEDDPDFSVAARYGVALVEPKTTLLSLDELVALRADGASGVKLPLRFDDDPSVWDSLEDPRHPGWLVRQEVQGHGLRGWLGLRLPFDPTSGVFLQSNSARLAFSELDRRLPCHGLLWVEDDHLTNAQRDLLHLAGLQLYQRLIGAIDEGDAAQREAARLYGTSFASALWRADAREGSTVRELARRIQVRGERGATWGTLDQWLSAPPSVRPALSEAMRAAAPLARAEAQPLEERLQSAFQGLAELSFGWMHDEAGPPYQIRYRGAQSVMVQFNGGDPLVERAVEADGRPRELLLLEVTRRVAKHLGAAADLMEIQAVLLAQRMRV